MNDPEIRDAVEAAINAGVEPDDLDIVLRARYVCQWGAGDSLHRALADEVERLRRLVGEPDWREASGVKIPDVDEGAADPTFVTVGQALTRLRNFSTDAPLLTTGYEGGFARVSDVQDIEVQELDRGDVADVYGPFAILAEAEQATTMPWPMHPRATRVGQPIRAAVLRRQGR